MTSRARYANQTELWRRRRTVILYTILAFYFTDVTILDIVVWYYYNTIYRRDLLKLFLFGWIHNNTILWWCHAYIIVQHYRAHNCINDNNIRINAFGIVLIRNYYYYYYSHYIITKSTNYYYYILYRFNFFFFFLNNLWLRIVSLLYKLHSIYIKYSYKCTATVNS